ncbi:VOC family protein [Chitinimonas naiadis]
MQLNHLDLPVPDVANAAAFFQACFDFTLIKTMGDNGMALLRGADGFILALNRTDHAGAVHYPRDFHIGFLQPSDEAVWDAYERLVAYGTDLPLPPQTMHGSLMFYFTAPGGITVEVSHRR